MRRKPVPSHSAAATPFLHKAEATHPVPRQGWSNSPRAIKTPTYVAIWSIVIDLLLLSCSVAFFSFPLVVKSYDRKSTSDHPQAKDRLLAASKYGPTVFPILFAAVVGRAAHAILVWRLEKGERIGVLDTLAGSTSLTSTVISLVQLRRFSILGSFLIIIWAFSPVGGQASFRQFSIAATKTAHEKVFGYTVPTGNLYGYGDSGRNSVWAIVNNLFNAAMIAPLSTKVSPVDLWGNVKIPRIESYENDHRFVPDEDGWFYTKMSDSSDLSLFSSLAGVPIEGIPISEGSVGYKMNLNTMYLGLDCSQDNIHDDMLLVDTFNVTHPDGNSAMLFWDSSFSVSEARSARANESIANDSIPALKFGYMNRVGYDFSVECSITTTYVEVEVSCEDDSLCLVSKIRRSTLDHPQPNITQFDIQSGVYWNWYTFAGGFVSSATSRPSYPTMIDYFIGQPENPVLPIEWKLLEQPADVYADRFGQLVNTYWSLTSAPYAFSTSLGDDTFYYDANTTFAIVDPNTHYSDNFSIKAERGLQARLWLANGTCIQSGEEIRAHESWIAVLCIASAILIIACLVPPVVRYFLTKGPDIMMNVSSLATRHNLYMTTLANNTHLDASERARLSRDFIVRFGDVETRNEIGRLAIAEWNDNAGLSVGRVQKGRLYM